MISKGNSVSERGILEDGWVWRVIGVVVGVIVGVLVGVVFKEGVIAMGFREGRCIMREEV